MSSQASPCLSQVVITSYSIHYTKLYEPGYDVICFGHTHRYTWLRHGTTWLLNPGCLQEGEGSLALLTLEPGKEPEARQVLVS